MTWLTAALSSRLAAAPPRARALLEAGAVAAAILLAVAEDPLLAIAGRAGVVGLALWAAARFLRRRADPGAPAGAIGVAERRALSREAAVALLHVRGRDLLVGYGPDGVRLLADLGAGRERRGEELP